MLDLLRFHCCNGHNGDIHFSREFIKYFMAHIPAKKYVFEHERSWRCVIDVPNLEFSKRQPHCKADRLWGFTNNQLSINTWVGCRGFRYLGYWDRVSPRDGCFIHACHHMFSDLINEIKRIGIHIPQLGEKWDYIPSIDYSYYQTENINKFVEQHPLTKILICNGPCLSGQIRNFSFNGLIKELAKNPKLTVITTERTGIGKTHFTGDIIKLPGCDLNEISYLSTFCRVIIGRGSGPYCFSEVKANVHDTNKRMIGITREPDWAFWWNNHRNMRWSSNFHDWNLIDMFYRALGEMRTIKVL